ncbi:MAG: metallophosphoesterase [Selenomonadaceae bacterium]|nr:metallophosphoesterase [Selenomonadaceae bacterium]
MFLIIVSGILAVILAFGLISVYFLLDGRSKRRFYKFFIFADLLITFLLIGSFLLRLNLPNNLVELLGSLATIFFMTQLFCGGLVLLAVIIRAVHRKLNPPRMFSPERRKILRLGLFYPLTAAAVSIYGNKIERMETVKNFFNIPIKNLPPTLENFKIAQISDVHLGAYYSLERLEKLLQKIADDKPDLLAITGDIFDSEEINSQAVKLVDSFTEKFKFGIYYCHGNHEHHRGISEIEKYLSETKIHWLVNRSENVTENLYILGVDYPKSSPIMSSGGRGDLDKMFEEQKKNFLEQALQNVPYDAVCILLAHHPEFIDNGIEKNIPLTLTGHTHGGQIGFFGMALLPLFKYTRGMVEKNNCFGYVHVGNGSWFPFRLGCPPEIAYFTLKKISD